MTKVKYKSSSLEEANKKRNRIFEVLENRLEIAENMSKSRKALLEYENSKEIKDEERVCFLSRRIKDYDMQIYVLKDIIWESRHMLSWRQFDNCGGINEANEEIEWIFQNLEGEIRRYEFHHEDELEILTTHILEKLESIMAEEFT